VFKYRLPTEGRARESSVTTTKREKGIIDINGIEKNHMCSQRWIASSRISIPM
jgi:hypothetical protein